MKVDVSEIKTFKACKRQWQLTSRNKFHLRPMITPPAFAFGTIFHEALAQLYLDVPLDKVMEMVRREMQPDTDAALLAMVPGYYKNVLPDDLERFTVLDIEHHFDIVPTTSLGEYLFPLVPSTDPKTGECIYDANGNPVMEPSLTICGSIDMIVLDKEEGKIYGFEHKTCKNFRDSSFMWMDEQPRVYTYALQLYVEEYNAKRYREWQDRTAQYEHVHPGENCPESMPEPATLGGIYINEVKKLLRDFKYQRTLCKYPADDLRNFMRAFFGSCCACHQSVLGNDPAYPSPSYFNCSMCDYKTICETYMYSTLDRDVVLEEFKEEFKIREADHLDEKAERVVVS